MVHWICDCHGGAQLPPLDGQHAEPAPDLGAARDTAVGRVRDAISATNPVSVAELLAAGADGEDPGMWFRFALMLPVKQAVVYTNGGGGCDAVRDAVLAAADPFMAELRRGLQRAWGDAIA